MIDRKRMRIKIIEALRPARGAVCILLFLFAFLLRFYNLDTVSPFSGDEAMHSASAVNYTEHGYFGPDNWYHPPLKHVLLYASVAIFGDDIYGLRLRNVLFGSATVALLFLLTRQAGLSAISAFFSSLLLLLDPLHILFSRTTFEDIPAVFFLVAGLFFTFRVFGNGRERDWIIAGCLFGLATALRLYSAVVLVVVFIFSVRVSFKKDGGAGIFRAAAYLVILPLTVYLAAYYPWFRRGYSLSDWLLMQGDALREMRHLDASSFHSVLSEIGASGTWFFKTIAVGFSLGRDYAWGRFIVIMNNLPVWIFILPAVLFMQAAAFKERNSRFTILGVSFWAVYILILSAGRPVFLYTSLCLLPAGFIAIGFATERLARKRAYAVIAVAASWSLLLYPLAVGISVPLRVYAPLLAFIKLLEPSGL